MFADNHSLFLIWVIQVISSSEIIGDHCHVTGLNTWVKNIWIEYAEVQIHDPYTGPLNIHQLAKQSLAINSQSGQQVLSHPGVTCTAY